MVRPGRAGVAAASFLVVLAPGCGGGAGEPAAQVGAPVAVGSSPAEPAAAEYGAPEVPDAVAAAPEVYATLHEDERVRVVEMNLGVGASDALHQHPHEVVYFLSGGKVRVDLPAGDPLEVELPDGAVLSHEPWTHTVTNVGETDIRAILVELKQEPGARPVVAEGADAVAVAPEVYTLLHDDERARVVEMMLSVGATDGLHTHPDEVAYFLGGGRLRITVNGESQEVDLPAGAVLSHEGWTHTVENIGETDVHAVLWELK